ncbi:hypothetical protein QAD02_009601 [Eretmocerus hayati]|uniref:Uncharacterized protein n=1 Tax=Eretmocerus hayati TaxID=131215 RepID=A0ACC2NB22_9HYME|nr:hypothetical protein QAD02_009601 [Eretmocerus hayati]
MRSCVFLIFISCTQKDRLIYPYAQSQLTGNIQEEPVVIAVGPPNPDVQASTNPDVQVSTNSGVQEIAEVAGSSLLSPQQRVSGVIEAGAGDSQPAVEAPRPQREKNAVDFLLECYRGEYQIDAFEYDKKMLEESIRNHSRLEVTPLFKPLTVAYIIIEHIIHTTRSYDISGEEFILWGKLCVITFVGTSLELWIQLSFREEDGTPHSPSGALYRAYKNIREAARKIERAGASRLQEKYWDEIAVENNTPQPAIVTSLDVWDRGAASCYQKAKNAPISEMIQDHPSIVSESGPLLLRRDYGVKFPSSINALINKWPDLADTLIRIARIFNAQKEVKKILRANPNIQTEVHKQNVAWMLLPALVRCFAKSPKKVANRDVSFEDIADSFIFHVHDFGKLETKQAELHFILQASGVPLRPYAIKCGSLENSENCFAVLEDVMFSMNSLTEAVDF